MPAPMLIISKTIRHQEGIVGGEIISREVISLPMIALKILYPINLCSQLIDYKRHSYRPINPSTSRLQINAHHYSIPTAGGVIVRINTLTRSISGMDHHLTEMTEI